MSKPIVLSDDIITRMTKEFEDAVRSMKLSDGKITYTKSFAYQGDDDTPVTVLFTPTAYIKMQALLQGFDSEVAWHGLVDRKSDDLFLITDIIVYPQEVTGATVNTDQEGYTRWLMELDDDTANHLHMQGHSHVRMGVTPSGTDLNHQEQILKQLSGDSFYIFMIWNKDLKHDIKIYDLRDNTLYEDDDIDVGIADDEFDLDSFTAQAKDLVKKKSYATVGSTASVAGKNSKSKGKTKGKTEPVVAKEYGAAPGYYGGNYGARYGYIDDYDQMIFGNHRLDT